MPSTPDMSAIYAQAKRTAGRLLTAVPSLRFVAAQGAGTVALNVFDGAKSIASAACTSTSVSVLGSDGYETSGKLEDLYQVVLSVIQQSAVATVEPGPDTAFIGSFVQPKTNSYQTLVCISDGIEVSALYTIQDAKFVEVRSDVVKNARCFLEVSDDPEVHDKLMHLSHFRFLSVSPKTISAKRTRYVEIVLSTHTNLQDYKTIKHIASGLLSSGNTLYFDSGVLSLAATLGAQNNFADATLEASVTRRALEDVKRIRAMLNGLRVYRVESSYKVVSRL